MNPNNPRIILRKHNGKLTALVAEQGLRYQPADLPEALQQQLGDAYAALADHVTEALKDYKPATKIPGLTPMGIAAPQAQAKPPKYAPGSKMPAELIAKREAARAARAAAHPKKVKAASSD